MREMPPRDAGTLAASPPTLPRAGPSAQPAAPPARPRLALRRLLASAVLLASAFVASQAGAQSSQPGLDGPVPLPDGVMMPPRMPRPGSSTTFEAPKWRFNFAGAQRFEAANTSHDGHLTQAQAEAAHMRGVGTHFAEIDSHQRGYVTFDELQEWRVARRAARNRGEK